MATSMQSDAALNAEEVKACCAALYESDWARLLLGESFHPGGLALTERLGALLCLRPDDHVLDVAAGNGSSALRLAERFGCTVLGVDYSAANVERANAAAHDAGLAERVRFVQGDAERLNLPELSVDALICECALCTFPDKRAATSEFRRVLRDGGRVGISDVTREAALPAELHDLLARVACIADAQPAHEYLTLLRDAGFADERVERHDEALQELVGGVRTRLLGAQLLLALGQVTPPFPAADLSKAQGLARAAAAAIAAGQLGYALIISAAPAAV